MSHLPITTLRKLAQSAVVLIVLAGLCAAAGGYVWQRWQLADQFGPQPAPLSGKWIKAAGPKGYSGCFRHEVNLSGEVRHAWLAVAACDSFEIVINGNPAGRHYLWRPTRPFQTGISEAGQRITPSPAMALNFPREYQWGDRATSGLPVWLDVGPFLRSGKNVLAVDVHSRRAPAKVQVTGTATLSSGKQVDLSSGDHWRAEASPPGIGASRWTLPDYNDQRWHAAQLAEIPTAKPLRTFPAEIYTQVPRAHWMTNSTVGNQQAVWFEQQWNLDVAPTEAWIRLATNRRFDLFINDQRVRTAAGSLNSLDGGQWLIAQRNGQDPVTMPELLDPDETGSIFVGNKFESPRGMHTNAELPEVASYRHSQWMNAADEGLNTDIMDPTITERSPISPTSLEAPIPTPERLTPKALARNRSASAYTAYSVARLLKPGRNVVQVRLSEFAAADPANWVPKVAVDGEARLSDGRQVSLGNQWSCWGQASPKQVSNATVLGAMGQHGETLPKLQYAGIALGGSAFDGYVLRCGLLGAAVGLLVIVLIACWSQFARRPSLLAGGWLRWAVGCLVPPLVVVAAAVLVESSWAERQEVLCFQQSLAWRIVAVMALGAGWLTVWLTAASRAGSRTSAGLTERTRDALALAPKTLAWKVAILALVLLCGGLRAYELDFQPLDDDEYASSQAILAIAETGVPGFVPEGVWYTRSPMYHYLGAAVVWLFGDHLWSLRLPSVLFSMATGLLAYRFGSCLMGRPWVGLGALALLAIHPFEVFTGHVARFYQAQQFFALLTIYWFCRGFVIDQKQAFRYLTILAFLASVLCQEISAAMGVQLAVGYVLFAKDLGWRANTKLIVLSGVALAIIAVDYLVFQTRCLTRVEGISPSLEATVKPHFWQPWNFFALLLGYSRLHLVLSCLLLVGLPLVWRERQKATLALNFMLIAGVVLMNLLVTHVSLRYQYWLIPLWILLSLDALRALVQGMSRLAFDPRLDRGSNNWLPLSCGGVLFAAVVLSWSPWRMIDSYDTKILGDSTGAMQYVRSQRQPGDKLMATEPHTHAGLLEAGGIDYDLSIPLLYDFVVLRDGKLVDRNAGAEAVGSLHDLMKVFRENDRLWIVVNREKFRTRGKNLRWQYPGARAELFLREHCEIKHQTYLWTVFLWDADAGVLRNFRQDGV